MDIILKNRQHPLKNTCTIDSCITFENISRRIKNIPLQKINEEVLKALSPSLSSIKNNMNIVDSEIEKIIQSREILISSIDENGKAKNAGKGKNVIDGTILNQYCKQFSEYLEIKGACKGSKIDKINFLIDQIDAFNRQKIEATEVKININSTNSKKEEDGDYEYEIEPTTEDFEEYFSDSD